MQVKEYNQRQWTKILAGRVSLADFVFAKEVRLGTYSARHGIVPPAAIVAGKAMAADPRMEPRYGERVPYVVVYGEPGTPLPMLHPYQPEGLYGCQCQYQDIIVALQRCVPHHLHVSILQRCLVMLKVLSEFLDVSAVCQRGNPLLCRRQADRHGGVAARADGVAGAAAAARQLLHHEADHPRPGARGQPGGRGHARLVRNHAPSAAPAAAEAPRGRAWPGRALLRRDHRRLLPVQALRGGCCAVHRCILQAATLPR